MSKAQGECFSPGAGERRRWRLSHQFCLMAIGDEKTGAPGQDSGRKFGVDRKEKPVAPLKVILPFLVPPEIWHAGFHFKDPNLSFLIERKYIRPAAAFQRELGQGCMAQRLEQAHRTAQRLRLLAPRLYGNIK
jgi:hypothetical protein